MRDAVPGWTLGAPPSRNITQFSFLNGIYLFHGDHSSHILAPRRTMKLAVVIVHARFRKSLPEPVAGLDDRRRKRAVVGREFMTSPLDIPFHRCAHWYGHLFGGKTEVFHRDRGAGLLGDPG